MLTIKRKLSETTITSNNVKAESGQKCLCKKCRCIQAKECIEKAVEILFQIMSGSMTTPKEKVAWQRFDKLLNRYSKLKSSCCSKIKEFKNV